MHSAFCKISCFTMDSACCRIVAFQQCIKPMYTYSAFLVSARAFGGVTVSLGYRRHSPQFFFSVKIPIPWQSLRKACDQASSESRLVFYPFSFTPPCYRQTVIALSFCNKNDFVLARSLIFEGFKFGAEITKVRCALFSPNLVTCEEKKSSNSLKLAPSIRRWFLSV